MTLKSKLILITVLKVIFIFMIKLIFFSAPIDTVKGVHDINEHLYNIRSN